MDCSFISAVQPPLVRKSARYVQLRPSSQLTDSLKSPSLPSRLLLCASLTTGHRHRPETGPSPSAPFSTCYYPVPPLSIPFRIRSLLGTPYTNTPPYGPSFCFCLCSISPTCRATKVRTPDCLADSRISLVYKRASPLPLPRSPLINHPPLPPLKRRMTSPPPPRSYYSISSDYSPTQTFDEDGDSFTSFGSIQTPPRLRAMIRSIFDGTLNYSDYGYAGSPHERVPDHIPAAIVAEGLNEALITPPTSDGAPMMYSSDQDAEYELDDSTTASNQDVEPDHPPVILTSAVGLCLGETFGDRRDRLLAALAPSIPGGTSAAYSSVQDEEYELDDSIAAATPGVDPNYQPLDVAGAVGSPDPNESTVFLIDPSLQVPPNTDDRDDIDSVFSLLDPDEDPKDTTYVPPKKSKKSYSGKTRFSGSFLAKQNPAFVRPRDSKGRFVSLRSKNLGKLKAASVDDQPPQSSSSSTSLPRAVVDSGHPHLTETALNTFLNTVLMSPNEAFPLSLNLPDPGDNPPKTIHDLYQHQWVLPPMLPLLLPTVY
ncbi:hypothetical protein PGT21_008614 [Puccinia graminis f. sp. tritici]|uniref:Uncharacterized protein n=1 Tax=Puccinia graminis f. sp. tritici TaxID=56615 RepID=A0A5B0MKG2_PUCGR|nr:hypothetical protein PGT21_008614 [Puccinia graminis f. sp. tritici]